MVTNDEFEVWILFLWVQKDLPLFQKTVTRKQAGSVELCGSEATKKWWRKTQMQKPLASTIEFYLMILMSGYKKETPCCTHEYFVNDSNKN